MGEQSITYKMPYFHKHQPLHILTIAVRNIAATYCV